MRSTVCFGSTIGQQAGDDPFEVVGPSLHCDGKRNKSKAVREHCPIVPVPVALKTFFRIVLLFQSEKFCKLWVAAFNLFSSGITMVCQVVRTAAASRHVDEPLKGKLRTLKPFGAMDCMEV